MLNALRKEARFEPVVKALEEAQVSYDDLECLTEDDVVEAVKASQASATPTVTLARIFFRRVLTDYLETKFTKAHYLAKPLKPKRADPIFVNYTLQAARRLTSEQFVGTSPDSLTIKELINQLSQPDAQAQLALLEYVSLAQCNFLDVDLPDLVTLVAFLSSRAQNDFVVDLSDNRIHGVTEFAERSVQDLLTNPRVKYLDLTTNPFCSFDKVAWFQTVERDQLLKLVWIPQPWISSKSWTVMIPNREDIWPQIEWHHHQFWAIKTLTSPESEN
eukprot:c20791_g1_i1.p1 GENE.c20791_g1_i1~~c20791_g1_i1.p1  ORF type:complete len:274 (+),score=49.80 c20791_g1_i1:40-861(+)